VDVKTRFNNQSCLICGAEPAPGAAPWVHLKIPAGGGFCAGQPLNLQRPVMVFCLGCSAKTTVAQLPALRRTLLHA